MTANELRRRFPNASEAFVRANSAAPLPASHPQPTQGSPLQRVSKGKKAGSYGPIVRTGLLFRVYACRPADSDGWDFKEVIDALAGAKILDGDGWDKCYIAGVYSEKVHSQAQERTEITILYPTESPTALPAPKSPPSRQVLIEQLWQSVSETWNRQAFDAFMETLSESDLQQYIQVGR
jgi:hypothetical protein